MPATAAAIEALDGGRLGPQDACGCRAISGLLAEAAWRGLVVRRLDLRNSGDTVGPKDRVVGYGAWMFREGALSEGRRHVG
jgi:MEMO1 family protein